MSDIDLLTLDLETTLKGNVDIGMAHPMCPANEAVLTGWRWQGVNYVNTDGYLSEVNKASFLVGHNISFDLLYMFRKGLSTKNTLQTFRIWDTQLAEYLLTGQQTRWSSLDSLCLKYGFPVKDDKIKKYFEAGIGSDKIPLDELKPYLERDLENTEAIALIQIDHAARFGMLPLIISQMEALHATTEMTFNGMHVDKEALDKYTVQVCNEFAECSLDLTSVSRGVVEDINSAQQWSKYFFGGFTKVKSKEAVGIYKNGNTKYKTTEKEIAVKGRSTVKVQEEWKSEKTGKISVDERTLEVIKNKDTDVLMKAVAEKLLKYRDLSKQLSTYVQGLSKHIQGDYIHGSINHCATVTGRLSSTRPNLQNISNNPIKAIFTSRWVDGWLVEVDFAQLEVAVLAHITKDKQLIKDISTGTDIHSALFKEMYGYTPTKEQRKPFKSLTFGLLYGAGFKTLSENAKCSIDEAKKFVGTFYARYPSVQIWHDSMKKKAELGGIHLLNVDTEELDKAATFIYTSETGRRYHFKEYFDDKRWSLRDYQYSPTELKNYPVQGLATGDIVPLMLGILFRRFQNRVDVACVNTIHDSILFDVTNEAIEDGFIKEVMDELGNTHKYFEATFGKPLALKLSAGVSVGRDWHNMKELEIW